jgi:RNA polymerase sigma-70 factor (ECF subfamily)
VSVMARLDSLRDPRVFGAWIASIARNRAHDWRRRRRDTVELDDDFAAEDATPSDEARASARAALAAIRALPEAYRETLVMRLVEGLSGPEIAQRTGLSPGSVRVNLHRGMQKLRERLNEGGDRG